MQLSRQNWTSEFPKIVPVLDGPVSTEISSGQKTYTENSNEDRKSYIYAREVKHAKVHPFNQQPSRTIEVTPTRPIPSGTQKSNSPGTRVTQMFKLLDKVANLAIKQKALTPQHNLRGNSTTIRRSHLRLINFFLICCFFRGLNKDNGI